MWYLGLTLVSIAGFAIGWYAHSMTHYVPEQTMIAFFGWGAAGVIVYRVVEWWSH